MMDSVEVATQFTVAIMANSNYGRKGADQAEAYANMFAQVLERVSKIIDPMPSTPPLPRPLQATSTVFPLSHER